MHHLTSRKVSLACVLLATSLSVVAQMTKPESESSSVPAPAQSQYDMASAAAKTALDALGLQLWGYARAGAYYAKDDLRKGGYGLGTVGFNRFGNEGDQFIEFGIGKQWNISGVKAGIYWMPYLYNSQTVKVDGTKQVYADISGLSFAPELSFWAGQRYHRIQDVHIIDAWLMEDGDNFGGGVDGFKLGSGGGTLNLAFHTEGNTDNSTTTSAAKRVNLQARDIPITPDGTLTLTAGVIRGNFSDKKTSFALGALYNQKFGVLKNSLFLQGSNGHANLSGKFYALNGRVATTTSSPFICTVPQNPDGSCPTSGLADNPNPTIVTSTIFNPGAKQYRIVDSINWQSGLFGGQALIGYETAKPSNTDKTTKNLGLGARLSYGVARNVKLYGDANYATLKTDGSSTQRLNKQTLGIAVAPNTDFWSRPEVRLYVSRVGGNDAVKATGAFGNRSNVILAGIQMEAWWE
ncbi:MAG: carbohydrate porin [Luteimonas sp.]|nr:carbohydrate porin [Luteimonas sp.]